MQHAHIMYYHATKTPQDHKSHSLSPHANPGSIRSRSEICERRSVCFFQQNSLPEWLLVFFIIHLYLNWGWIKMNFFKRRRNA